MGHPYVHPEGTIDLTAFWHKAPSLMQCRSEKDISKSPMGGRFWTKWANSLPTQYRGTTESAGVGEFMKVGSRAAPISERGGATNGLADAIKKKKFREDPLPPEYCDDRAPPLRERGRDIPIAFSEVCVRLCRQVQRCHLHLALMTRCWILMNYSYRQYSSAPQPSELPV